MSYPTTNYKGHMIIFKDDKWQLPDGTDLSDIKNCKHCGKDNINGADDCLGILIGVKNACCGHGDDDDYAYIQFYDDKCIIGKDAIVIQDILKKYSK